MIDYFSYILKINLTQIIILKNVFIIYIRINK